MLTRFLASRRRLACHENGWPLFQVSGIPVVLEDRGLSYGVVSLLDHLLLAIRPWKTLWEWKMKKVAVSVSVMIGALTVFQGGCGQVRQDSANHNAIKQVAELRSHYVPERELEVIISDGNEQRVISSHSQQRLHLGEYLSSLVGPLDSEAPELVNILDSIRRRVVKKDSGLMLSQTEKEVLDTSLDRLMRIKKHLTFTSERLLNFWPQFKRQYSESAQVGMEAELPVTRIMEEVEAIASELRRDASSATYAALLERADALDDQVTELRDRVYDVLPFGKGAF